MASHSSLLQFFALIILFSSNTYSQETTPSYENCDYMLWEPVGTIPPDNPECVAYDDSLLPDCGQYDYNLATSFYHVHEYNCSRFWECSPQGPCLFECAPCPADSGLCNNQEALSFDCRYQYPVGPVCDWPGNVLCVGSTQRPTTSTTTPDPGCITDDDCQDNEWCDTSGFPGVCRIGCRDDSGCSATSCSTCVEHVCHDPECCGDSDCSGTSCSTCGADQMCHDPECCGDSDCNGTTCSTCGSDQMCHDPECCDDTDCNGTSCSTCGADQMCHDPDCCEDTDCNGSTCSTCEDNICHDPECCDDTDCPDVTNQICSMCFDDFTCSRPECCVDEDCNDGFVCENQLCVPEGECDAQRPCEGANEICHVPEHDNCQYCDEEAHPSECKPGCADDANCPNSEDENFVCVEHLCQSIGVNGITNITVNTKTCSQCEGSGNPLGVVEGGVQLHLIGLYGTECYSDGLDNLEKVDYDNGFNAFFDGSPDNDGDDDGMGECKGADTNYGLEGGSATWTGKGTWTAADSEAICIKFYDPFNDKPTCCCSLQKPTLTTQETSELTNCECKL